MKKFNKYISTTKLQFVFFFVVYFFYTQVNKNLIEQILSIEQSCSGVVLSFLLFNIAFMPFISVILAFMMTFCPVLSFYRKNIMPYSNYFMIALLFLYVPYALYLGVNFTMYDVYPLVLYVPFYVMYLIDLLIKNNFPNIYKRIQKNTNVKYIVFNKKCFNNNIVSFFVLIAFLPFIIELCRMTELKDFNISEKWLFEYLYIFILKPIIFMALGIFMFVQNTRLGRIKMLICLNQCLLCGFIIDLLLNFIFITTIGLFIVPVPSTYFPTITMTLLPLYFIFIICYFVSLCIQRLKVRTSDI